MTQRKQSTGDDHAHDKKASRSPSWMNDEDEIPPGDSFKELLTNKTTLVFILMIVAAIVVGKFAG